MLFYFIFSINYLNKFGVYSLKNQFKMPSFGFDANGTYLIDVQNIPDTLSKFEIAFLNKKQYKKYFFKFFPPSICEMQNIQKYTITYYQHILEGKFDEKIELYPFLLRCEPMYEKFDLTIYTEYRNPTTYLDNRMVNGIYGELAICLIYILLAAAWIFNLIKNSQSKNELHYYITAIILLFTFSHILRFFELRQMDKTDNTKYYTNFRIFFNFLCGTFTCFFILVCSEGFCILVDTIPKQRIIMSVIVSMLLNGSLYFTFYYNFSENYVKIVFLDLVFLIFYGYELFQATKRANAQIAALLLSDTDQAGIKNKKYIDFQRILIVILIVLISLLILSNISFLIPSWVNELFVSLIEIGIICATAFIFMPKSQFSSSGITRRLIEDDGDDDGAQTIGVESTMDGDEIPLMSLDGPTPNQPLLQETNSSKNGKKVNGNNYLFL